MEKVKKSNAGASGLTRRQILQRSGLAIATIAAAEVVSPRSGLAKPSKADVAPSIPTPGPATRVFRVARTTLNPDGKKDVSALSYNGTYPGPEIRVREGDLVRFQLENHLETEKTATHWHGVLLPAAMDGVPGVSGPPVDPKEVFVYEYPIRQAGTYWYHSHYGLQEQIGLAGAFIIEPKHEPGRFDRDAVVLLADWTYENPDEIIPRLRAEAAKKPPMDMKAGPMGGGGMKTGGADLSDVKYDAFLMNGTGTQAPWTFEARAGERIRLRLINGSSSTFFFVSMDGHPFEITHADGEPVRPVVVDRILMGTGETYDAIVKIAGSGSYTLHGVAQDGSGQAVGVIHTRDAKPAPSLELPQPGPRLLSYAQLQSLEATTLPAGEVRDFRLVLGGDMTRYVWTINGEAYPDAQPLLVRQGDRVQVEIVNDTGMWHPMHLHGHFFRLLAADGPFAPLKHTVGVAPSESVRFEFTADNPGDWFFHCHNLFHLEAGMARVWKYQV